jgi:hypothetical protein
MHVRVCPECHEEYRPEIVACADCGVDLVDADDESPAEVAAAPPEGQEAAWVLHSSTDARDLTPLADELVSAGVPFRILSQVESPNAPSGRTRYSLVVPEDAIEDARGVVAAVAERHPDLGLRAIPAALGEAEWDAEIEAVRSRSSCPACTTHFPPGALECPGCGLAFGREEGGE